MEASCQPFTGESGFELPFLATTGDRNSWFDLVRKRTLISIAATAIPSTMPYHNPAGPTSQ